MMVAPLHRTAVFRLAELLLLLMLLLLMMLLRLIPTGMHVRKPLVGSGRSNRQAKPVPTRHVLLAEAAVVGRAGKAIISCVYSL